MRNAHVLLLSHGGTVETPILEGLARPQVCRARGDEAAYLLQRKDVSAEADYGQS